MNLLLSTDVYKLGHLRQYPKGTTKVYSYLQARSDKKLPYTLFYGLQYYLKLLENNPPCVHCAKEFFEYHKGILGNLPEETETKIMKLANLGYWPIKIKAVAEGTIVPNRNVLMTLVNTHPDFYWVPGFLESLLLKVWNTCTVASYSKFLQKLVKKFSDETCDNDGHLPYQVHDFGYRGCSSEETAALSGSAHLVNFLGTDTVLATKLVREIYGCDGPIGLSVPATEHSVMCAYKQENEYEAFENMLSTYPSGIVSIVSDTYNLWNVLTTFIDRLKTKIVTREGKVVFRPDSGDPEKIICGDHTGPYDYIAPEYKGALQLLWEKFGGTVNSKGYKVLNPKVGLIYGDGMYYDRFEKILQRMQNQGWASSNLVVGIGGLLLQQHSRDDLGFAIKATYAEVNGDKRELFKDPVTDSKKRSHKGMLALCKNQDGGFFTLDQCSETAERFGELKTVFEDGKIVKSYTFDEVRANARG